MTDSVIAPRGFRQPRCPGCALSRALCVCELWPPLSSELAISVVMPRSEARSASNSARLLALWLPQTELHVCGGQDGITEAGSLLERPGGALLFPTFRGLAGHALGLPVRGRPAPHPQAPAPEQTPTPLPTASAPELILPSSAGHGTLHASISRTLPDRARHLIVPDGTWSQARRIERRWFAPHALPRIELHGDWPSVYQLRRSSQGVCTFEAASIALGLLADAPVAGALLHRFAEWARRAGQLKTGGPWPGGIASLDQHALHPAAAYLAASERGASAARS
jgi:tRNA-uridine aminocarboxypropyltransferase